MAALTVPGYDVPMAPTTGGIETMADTIDSLLALRDTCDAIFDNVVRRVDKLRDQYEAANERVMAAAGRVDELRTRKEAMLVLSAPRFPSKAHYDRGIAQATHRSDKAFRRRKPRPVRVMDAGAVSLATGGGGASSVAKRPTRPLDPAGAFEFRMMLPARDGMLAREKLYRPGLGSLPRKFTAISSANLFNTGENPYREYHDINIFSLSRAERQIAQQRQLGDHGLKDDFTTKAAPDGFEFVPVLEGVVDIAEDLPADMPLDDLAQLTWDDFDAPTIAPSGQRVGGGRGEHDDELPSVSDRAGGIRPSKPLPLPPTVKSVASPPSAGGKVPPPPPLPGKGGPPGATVPQIAAPPMPGGKAPPPPPPPPPGKTGPPLPIATNAPAPPPPPPPPGAKGKVVGGPPGAPPPPPPPPGKLGGPPGKAPPPPPPPPGKAGPGKGPAPPPPTDDRSTFLDSIKAFNKDNLKPGGSGAPAPPPGKKAPEKPRTDASALMEQLQNRRDAMMGKTDAADEDDEPSGGPKKPVRIGAGGPGKRPPPPAKAPPPAPRPNPLAKKPPAGRGGDDDDDW
eukprot:CAMPEP_0174830450 /NCGR_PEP_ID=MMETSP1114-20130205/2523_1 /TAXON_ID=312471 /ORGANISM="Neobodo designis, Strain CCAP 1951/1" /LENGTH=565 /DNA_ID=CAMNT_0016064249 /DNA_START=47 /DNA_END=1744 /DNA_ORIENTATION=-